MKIAIVHDWLVSNAGAEKVLHAILELYPKADIYSLVDFLNAEDRDKILGNRSVKRSFIQHLPFATTAFRNYLPLFPTAIESFDLSSYDLVISSSWAVAKGVKTHKNQIHVCYCHTPIRYAWDLHDEYLSNLKGLKKYLVKLTLQMLRNWDLKTLHRVDHFIANSHFVKERIKRIYGVDSTLIYPPVDTEKFALQESKDGYYLTASRLVPYKKTALIVEAFASMPDRRLVVIGSGEELEHIRSISTSNVKVMGYQSDAVLVEKMGRAKAFIYAAVEDFGIINIEALSCGTPVIALNHGGTAETIDSGKSGTLFEKQTAADIAGAVDEFESQKFDPKDVRTHSLRYSRDRFLDEFREFINSVV